MLQADGTITPLNNTHNYVLSEQQAGEILAQVFWSFSTLHQRKKPLELTGIFPFSVFVLVRSRYFPNRSSSNFRGNTSHLPRLLGCRGRPCCLRSSPPPAPPPCIFRFLQHKLLQTILAPPLSTAPG